MHFFLYLGRTHRCYYYFALPSVAHIIYTFLFASTKRKLSRKTNVVFLHFIGYINYINFCKKSPYWIIILLSHIKIFFKFSLVQSLLIILSKIHRPVFLSVIGLYPYTLYVSGTYHGCLAMIAYLLLFIIFSWNASITYC